MPTAAFPILCCICAVQLCARETWLDGPFALSCADDGIFRKDFRMHPGEGVSVNTGYSGLVH